MTLAEAFRSIRRNLVVLPARAQCPDCGFFNTMDPEVIAIIREAGRDLNEAACKCQEKAVSRKLEAVNATARRWNDAGLPHGGEFGMPRTMETWEDREGAEEAAKAVRAILAKTKGTPPFLVLLGESGTGKSHLLEAAGRQWLHDGGDCRYDVGSDLLRRLRATFDRHGQDTLDAIFEDRAGTGLLLLDDFGREKSSDWTIEQMTGLVDYRYRESLWTIVATNLGKEEMAEHLGYRIASRLWDRSGTVRVVNLTCSDYREVRR